MNRFMQRPGHGARMAEGMPRLLVFSSLFPSQAQPQAGLFIRERMFRVSKRVPLVVVAPVPWFPLQGLLRLFKPHYRPMPPKLENQDGIPVYHPRFLSVPGLFRAWDGMSMALGSWRLVRRLKRDFGCTLLDAHFAYPDGYAASLLGGWLGLPVTVTLRGTEIRHSREPGLRRRLVSALHSARHIFSVAESLKRHAVSLGIPADKVQVVGNGVDTDKFRPVDKANARKQLGLTATAPVLVSVGGLVERKGFHRVIDCLPALRERYPEIQFLIVGGASSEGDMRATLETQVRRLNLQGHVRFLGAMPAAELHVPLSAADLFVLATRNEGWANVFLEAMACGLPVVTTDVGGNREVVCQSGLGTVVPFGDRQALLNALTQALETHWDRAAIRAYAEANTWQQRVDDLVSTFRQLHAAPTGVASAGGNSHG